VIHFDALPDRIRDRINVIPETECWDWVGTISRIGYGHVWFEGKTWLAHRVVFTLLRGAIPHGLTLDHLCRNRCCVNPDHLQPVTLRENVLRGTSPAAQKAKQTHCKRGHPLTEGNLVRDKYARRCKLCHRETGKLAQRRYLLKRRS